LAKQIITLYHAGQKLITKDQQALVTLVIYGQAFVYIGGGANIGAGLMIIYSPIAYIGAISIGWAIGELFCSMPREH